jgi:hypothetical protein
MKQTLEGVSDLELYLMHSFIHHCTHASMEFADLRNDLMQLCDLWPCFDIVLSKFPTVFRTCRLYLNGCKSSVLLSIFFALKSIQESQTDMAAKELSSHIQSLWDQYLTSKLGGFTFHESNVGLNNLTRRCLRV